MSRKTVFNLIKRGQLDALPGIRHKRITEAALARYLGISGNASGHSVRPSSGHGATKGQSVGRSNGEGCGVASRVSKPKEIDEKRKCC